jgi:hypothetical protein
MALIVWKATLFTLALVGIGCTAYTSSFQSPFFFKFSLQELVQRTKSHASLNCSARGGGGGIGTGGGGIGRESHFHKGESFSCQMTDDGQFEEAKFIQALKQGVEADLDESKAKIVSSDNLDATSFYFEYALEDIRGRVEISGRKGPGKYYSLQADLDEKKGEAK